MQYLLKPPEASHASRNGAATAVLFLYFLFFLAIAITYFRLLYVVATNPGFVERSEQWYAQNKGGKGPRLGRKASGDPLSEKRSKRSGSLNARAYSDAHATADGATSEQRPSLQEFFKRDAFVCQGDGRPAWCSHCQNWKPDRAHHCREVDRCVRKMDHFCPWVGGIISETSFKFFIQFVGWATIYCFFVLITTAIFIAEHQREQASFNVHWVVVLALAALFGLFAAGMTGSSLQFAFLNTTTIENLSRQSMVYQLAIYMLQPPQEQPVFPTITFSTAQNTSSPTKTFAILHSKPGQNPWDLGLSGNFKSVMGENWHEWFLPIRYSPCCNHERYDSQFALGPVLDEMRQEAGISAPSGKEDSRKRRRHKRRKRPSTKSVNNQASGEKVGSGGQLPDHGRDRFASRQSTLNDRENNA